MKTALAAVFFVGLLEANSGFFVGKAKAEIPDALTEVVQFIADAQIGVRFGREASRRCFIAVQALIDGDVPSAPETLSDFLEQVCYQGMRSELEREGILSLFSSIGLEAQRRRFDNTTEEQSLMASAVDPCWNVWVLSATARNVSLRVSFELDSFGRHVNGTIRLVDAAGGDEDAVQQAFEAARRAIIRCEGEGYPNAMSAGEYELNFKPIP